MVEKQSESGRDAQLAMLLRHKWQAEIEKDVTKERKKIVVREFLIEGSQAALAQQDIPLIVQKMATTGESLVFCPPLILA